MRPLKVGEGREAVKDSVMVWRSWQLKQLGISEGCAVSMPSIQHFFQEYQLICMQSGGAHYQYRNTRISGQVVDEALLVIEPAHSAMDNLIRKYALPHLKTVHPGFW